MHMVCGWECLPMDAIKNHAVHTGKVHSGRGRRCIEDSLVNIYFKGKENKKIINQVVD